MLMVFLQKILSCRKLTILGWKTRHLLHSLNLFLFLVTIPCDGSSALCGVNPNEKKPVPRIFLRFSAMKIILIEIISMVHKNYMKIMGT